MAGGPSRLLGCPSVPRTVVAGDEYPRRTLDGLRSARLGCCRRNARSAAASPKRQLLVRITGTMGIRRPERAPGGDRRNDSEAVRVLRGDGIRKGGAADDGRYPSVAEDVPLWNGRAAYAVGARWRTAPRNSLASLGDHTTQFSGHREEAP